MRNLIEAAKQAIGALEKNLESLVAGVTFNVTTSAITNLRAAIKQAEEAEPVAWKWDADLGGGVHFHRNSMYPMKCIPLYTNASFTPQKEINHDKISIGCRNDHNEQGQPIHESKQACCCGGIGCC